MFAQGGDFCKNSLLSLSLCQIEPYCSTSAFPHFTSRPYPGSGLILGWLASVLVTELYLYLLLCQFLSVLVCRVMKIITTLPNMYGLDISGRKYFVDKYFR